MVKSKIDSNYGFQIIFMDLNMPLMNGIEATKHIREYEIQNK